MCLHGTHRCKQLNLLFELLDCEITCSYLASLFIDKLAHFGDLESDLVGRLSDDLVNVNLRSY